MADITASTGHDIRITGIIGTVHFFSHFYMLVLPPIFVVLKSEFGLSHVQLGALVAAFAVASGAGQIPAGFLVDRLGARAVLIGGLAILAGAVTLMGLSTSYAAMLLLSFLAGAGNSVVHPADYTILSVSIDARRVGRAFGFHTFSGQLGWAAAPAVMTSLGAIVDWRTAMVLVGGVGLVMVLLLAARRGDLPGESDAPAAGESAGSRPRASLFSAPILLLFAFFVVTGGTVIGLNAFSVTALPLVHGISMQGAGYALSVFLLGGAAGLLAGGVLADYSTRIEVVVATGLTGAAAMLVVVAALRLPPLSVILAMGLAGFMMSIITPSRDMLVRGMAPRGSSGKVFGFISSGLDLGSAAAPLLFGWVIDGGAPRGIFWMSAALILVSMALAIAAARRVHPA